MGLISTLACFQLREPFRADLKQISWEDTVIDVLGVAMSYFLTRGGIEMGAGLLPFRQDVIFRIQLKKETRIL